MSAPVLEQLSRLGAAEGVTVLAGEPFPGPGAGIDGLGRWIDPAAVRRALAQLDDATTHVVLVSSAMVYGAWPNNPVPLTEEAVLRPEPGNGLAVACGEAERLVARWRDDRPGRSVTVLRPALVVHEGQGGWLARSPWGGRGPALVDPEPPVQFLHLDDLVTAIDLAVATRHDGVLNVAPEGWLRAEDQRALAGPAPRLALPAPLARRVRRLQWDAGPLVPFEGVVPYLCHPWVVASDALRALGWRPQWTNEEAFVAASPAGPLTGMNPKRRQMVALGGAAALIAAALAGVVVALRRADRA